MIECVEKLRKLCQEYGDELITIRPFNILQMLEAIEAEVAERYIELPVDADGVPVKLGDILYADDTDRFAVHEIIYYKGERYTINGYWLELFEFHHVKPRAVEDVLRELRDESRQDQRDFDLSAYADELREMSNSQ